jgi:hypothetical protein
MLSKKSYRQVVKSLDHYRKQNEEDRKENPNSIPIDWKSSLLMMVERTVRDNRERWSKEMGIEVLEYLVTQKLLVPYHGGYTFPGQYIPSKEEIQQEIAKSLKQLTALN